MPQTGKLTLFETPDLVFVEEKARRSARPQKLTLFETPDLVFVEERKNTQISETAEIDTF